MVILELIHAPIVIRDVYILCVIFVVIAPRAMLLLLYVMFIDYVLYVCFVIVWFSRAPRAMLLLLYVMFYRLCVLCLFNKSYGCMIV